MSKTIEIEVDDVHELMFTQMMDNAAGGDEDAEAPELEEWAEDTVKAMIYNSYTNQQ